MDWKLLDITDKALFKSFFKKQSSEASELTFTNLFLWKNGSTIAFKIIDDFLCIKHINLEEHPLLFAPFGDGNKAEVISKLMQEWNEMSFTLQMTPITFENVESIMTLFPGKFDYFPESDHSDYIYSVSDLINLPGRKYHDKKNMLNRFIKDNKFEYLPITDHLIKEVKTAVQEWCEIRNCEDSLELEHEKDGIFDCLDHFKELDCEGAVIRVGGKIIAVTLGEALTDDMVVIHIEKADPRITGSYQIINQQFLYHRWSDYKWVNREGDMGLEGLRKSKLSYNPVRMIDKFCLRQIR